MTYNVFGGMLNLTQPTHTTYWRSWANAGMEQSTPSYLQQDFS